MFTSYHTHKDLVANTLDQNAQQMTTFPKKVWKTPEFMILDSYDINTKTLATFHEGTVVPKSANLWGTQSLKSGYSFTGAKSRAYS